MAQWLVKEEPDHYGYDQLERDRKTVGIISLTREAREVDAGLSKIQHVVFIIKENRTYDQVFGDMPQGNGEKELCLFPEAITPNHHKLAREFVLLDNFYCSGVLSADGH